MFSTTACSHVFIAINGPVPFVIASSLSETVERGHLDAMGRTTCTPVCYRLLQVIDTLG